MSARKENTFSTVTRCYYYSVDGRGGGAANTTGEKKKKKNSTERGRIPRFLKRVAISRVLAQQTRLHHHCAPGAYQDFVGGAERSLHT